MGEFPYQIHFEHFQSLLQSCMTFLQECIHLSLAEEMCDLVSLLLCLNEDMYLMKGAVIFTQRGFNDDGMDQHLVNFPTLSNIAGVKFPVGSACMCKFKIAHIISWMFSMHRMHSSLFLFTFFNTKSERWHGK